MSDPRRRVSAPSVSVLLPVRDGEVHLPEAIASLEAQTHADFEVLAVDDGSTDRTPEILADWARRDARVEVLRQEPAGIVAALEAGRERASAPYLARMDADDVAAPARFARQLALMEAEGDLAGCGCRVRYFPDGVVGNGARRYEAWLNGAVTREQVAREIFVECPLAHPALFLKASVVSAVAGFRDSGWPEDYDLVLRIWEAGGGLANVPQVLLHWREGPDRLSRTHPRYSEAAFRRCKVHFLSRTLLGARRGAVIWGAGPVGKAFGRALDDVGESVRAYVDVDPRKIGQEIGGVPVLDTADGLEFTRALHIAAVGQPGVREQLRGLLTGAGMVELRDFVAVA